MRILCAISGIQFNVDHFPASLTSRECYHPIFVIPQKKLLQYTLKWANRELTQTDTYLLFLSLLHSTELIEWRVPAQQTDKTRSIIEQNMEALIDIVGKINIIKHPSFVLSKVSINPETKTLTSAHYWIKNWHESYNDFITGYKNAKIHDKIAAREQSLERLIKDAQKPISHYARILADWAEMAADFPAYQITFENKTYPINEYWKNIIVRCCKEEQIFAIPKEHLEKLIEHCEENLEGGSIYSYTLMSLLRSGVKKQSNYLGLGDIDIQESIYRILPNEATVEDANRMAMIDTAPTELPIEKNYPSKLAYLRAKVKWDMKVAYMEQQVVVAKLNKQMDEAADKLINLPKDDSDSDDSDDESGTMHGRI